MNPKKGISTPHTQKIFNTFSRTGPAEGRNVSRTDSLNCSAIQHALNLLAESVVGRRRRNKAMEFLSH